MNKPLIPLLRLVLLTALLAIASLGFSQTRTSAAPQKPKLTITDNAGRVHVRPVRQRITVAQRKAAAQQRKARVTKAAQNKAATVQSSEVKK